AGEVVVADGRIEDVSQRAAAGRSGAAIELGERWLVPGYIDTHVHGGGGAQINTTDLDEVAAVARFHAEHGTTALLATTVAAPVEVLSSALRTIARAVEHGGVASSSAGAAVLGAHLEGPFLSSVRPGAMDPSCFLAPDSAVLERLLAASDGTMRMMTLAPELQGALDLVRALVRVGAIASLGHTDASYEEARSAAVGGARSATHLFNGMRPFHHREPGAIGAALDSPQVNCELICDGIHVAAAALRVIYRAKGPHGIRLVTDAMEAAGMPDGTYRLGGAAVEVQDGAVRIAGGGSIAGSTLTMDVAVRNAVNFLAVPVEVAVSLASSGPARLLGIDDRKGAIAVGMDADLVVLDEELLACGTIVGGEWVGEPPVA
ncbi:MAG: N-acetylglucosamine-6-phosphate deacetylase, partial [Solirubrobacterales bacterium]|nr:N-acetylglucosamine-6-phosphate deacetylase [Solirubrobacterales bacterium]